MLAGEAPLVEGLTSQNGNKYDARLTFDDNAELEFIFDD